MSENYTKTKINLDELNTCKSFYIEGFPCMSEIIDGCLRMVYFVDAGAHRGEVTAVCLCFYPEFFDLDSIMNWYASLGIGNPIEALKKGLMVATGRILNSELIVTGFEPYPSNLDYNADLFITWDR